MRHYAFLIILGILLFIRADINKLLHDQTAVAICNVVGIACFVIAAVGMAVEGSRK